MHSSAKCLLLAGLEANVGLHTQTRLTSQQLLPLGHLAFRLAKTSATSLGGSKPLGSKSSGWPVWAWLQRNDEKAKVESDLMKLNRI